MTAIRRRRSYAAAKPHCGQRVEDNAFHLRAPKAIAQFVLGVFENTLLAFRQILPARLM
jgi:NAD dependent epimerase/dehydratase family enzyme